MQDAVSLLRPDDLLRQQPSVRLAGQHIEAEQGLPFALMAQRHVPRRLIEIRLEAAVPYLRLFGEQIGENVQHQLLRLVNVVQIAVDIQGQGVAVFFHQGIEPFVVAVQILAVQALVAGHSVHLLFADASHAEGYPSGACPAGIAVLSLKARVGRFLRIFRDRP